MPSHQTARELAAEFTPTLVEVFAVQRPQKRVAERRKPRRASPRPHGTSGQAKALGFAVVILLMVCAYAFGVLGRDTAVGLALKEAQFAMTAPQALPPPPAPSPELVIPLENIPIGEPWFSAPEVAPAENAAVADPAPKVSKRRKR